MKTTAAYGTWLSPLSPRMLAGAPRLLDVQWATGAQDADAASGRIVWLESRAGATTLMTADVRDLLGEQGAPRELTEGETVRGKISYGGGEFTVGRDFVIYVGNGGRLYWRSLHGGHARALTPPFGTCASPCLSADERHVAYVHHYEGEDYVAVVDVAGRHLPARLTHGDDFIMQLTWHKQGEWFSYIGWNFPAMPWDATTLYVDDLDIADRGRLPIGIVKGRYSLRQPDTAYFQPIYSPDNRYLAYVSDESGWWQVYTCDLKTLESRQHTHALAEHAVPAWLQGMRTIAWRGGRHLLAIRNQDTVYTLVQVDIETGDELLIQVQPYTYLEQLAVSPDGTMAALIASNATTTPRVIVVDLPPLDAPGAIAPAAPAVRLLRRSTGENIPPEALSPAQPITWQGHDGESVFGIYYPPAGPYEGIGLPPLIVYVHGGPTSQSRLTYSPEMQFYATRGFAVLQVNHRGSTGYGKAYKDKHRGAWGVWDVEDAASGAAALAARGLADPAKFVILGGSAGGYTVLQSLVDKPGFYRAGVCLYGISNQFTLVMETSDKFELRYSDTLLGVLPQASARYRDRSPLFHADRIADPLILFQGEDDTNVPKSQSDAIAAALAARGVPHEYHVYAGEGHGFRKPETIEDYLNRTLSFLLRWVVYA